MKWFYNLKITAKLIIGFIVVAMIAGAVGVVGVTNINRIDQNYTELFEDFGIALGEISQVDISFQQTRVLLRDLIIDTDKNSLDKYVANIGVHDENINKKLQEFEKSIKTDEARKEFDSLKEALNEFAPVKERIISLAVASQKAEATAILRGEGLRLASKIQTHVDNLIEMKTGTGRERSEEYTTTTNRTVMTMAAIIAGAMLIAVGLGLLISRIIGKPIRKMVDVANSLTLGDVSVNVEVTTKDETGILTASFQKMIENIRNQAQAAEQIASGDVSFSIAEKSDKDVLTRSINLVKERVNSLIQEADKLSKAALEGKLDTRGDLSKFQGGYHNVIQGMNNTLDAIMDPLNFATDYLKRMADGENMEEINSTYQGDYNIIMNSLNQVRASLYTLLDETGKLSLAGREGNLSVRGDLSKLRGGYKNIVQGVNDTLDAVIKPVQEASDVLEEMAKGNLTVGVNGDYKGDHAKIKNALNETINAFNDVLNDLNSASDQVASGAKQISDSSQALSQGATEQASTIEELTASTEEISSQTKINAQNAGEASRLAETARENAMQGNEQMKGMLNSMVEINDASANISKIIKVIDDIAFQTNILALNAAVEAARAGQHGKGFAVVAEEVRNLAARSADAAKETTEMIESSIKKTEEGTKIASSTANALNSIVEVVTRVASIVGDISTASNEQASGIAQINQGIIQVSQVVQTNSATSEEAAASSEELSSQAELLKRQVERFKLKKAGQSELLEGKGINPDVLRLLENMAEKKGVGKGVREEESGKEPFEPLINLSDTEFGKY